MATRVTIRDVARLADTSIATVSRVINGKRVSEESRRKVLEAITETNYRVGRSVGRPRVNRSHLVGVVVPSMTHPYWMRLCKAIQNELEKHDYGALVMDSDFTFEKEQAKVEFALRSHVDGIIIVPIGLAAEKTRELLLKTQEEVPMVMVDNLVDGVTTDTVVPDDTNSVYQAIQTFIVNGHRRISMIIGPQRTYTGKERLVGYKRVFEDYKLPISEDLIREATHYDAEHGYSLMRELMALDCPPTAVLTTNFDLTRGAILALRDLGVKIPEHISFIGFDFGGLSDLFEPQISTIDQPVDDIAKETIRLLYRQITEGKPSGPPEFCRVPTRLDLRGSVRRISP
jgi:LacI family transcriptional regulator